MGDGSGQISVKKNPGDGATPKVEMNLFDFTHGESTLKRNHIDHIVKDIVPQLKRNGKSKVTLIGSADASGQGQFDNQKLSTDRANAVAKVLRDNGIDAQVVENKGIGVAPGAPVHSDVDRSVRILLEAPLTVTEITLHTDDWSRKLKWDDVVGLKGEDSKTIKRFNIRALVTGATRGFMPNWFPIMGPVTNKAGKKLSDASWQLGLAPRDFQPTDDTSTAYQASLPPAGFAADAPEITKVGVTIVGREKVKLEIDLNTDTFIERGVAAVNEPGSETSRLIGPEQLIRAGGVEPLTFAGPDKRTVKWFQRRWTGLFIFWNNGTRGGSLSSIGESWKSPKELWDAWEGEIVMTGLVLAAPFVLEMNVVNGTVAIGGPGAEWAKMLKAKNGGPSVILGYANDAPSMQVRAQLINAFCKKVGAGRNSFGDWVEIWLDLNLNHSGKDTWNAVGMDGRGYSWIRPWATWGEVHWPSRKTVLGPKADIEGPLAIP
jgi:hypothetical protein